MSGFVSVIIPTYNSKRYLCDAIDSALAQTYKNIEIIVVDDGSTDNTLDVLRKYGDEIQVSSQKNAGPSAARNKGIRQAKGEHVAFLDSDDVWFPKKLQEQVLLMEKNPNLGATNCSGLYISEDGKEVGEYQQCNFEKHRLSKELLFHNCIKVLSGGLIRRECFDKIGLFDEKLAVAEDWDMWMRLCRRYDFMGSNLKLVKYRIHKGSQSSRGKKNLENELIFLNKVFSDFSINRSFLLKRKVLSYRYQAAAVAFREEKNRAMALEYILKSIYCYPLFEKKTLALFLYGLGCFQKS